MFLVVEGMDSSKSMVLPPPFQQRQMHMQDLPLIQLSVMYCIQNTISYLSYSKLCAQNRSTIFKLPSAPSAMDKVQFLLRT